MSIVDLLIGRPIASSDERGEQIGVSKGIPVFGLDALSSAAYGPEAALVLLIPLGLAGLKWIVPISAAIIVLLAIVFFSYRQTIAAYPGGGGSYTVAKENLGTFPGLLAAAALLIDYVLAAAVGISAGIGALTSAVPALHSRTLMLCLVALLLMTLVNLRGVTQTGGVFILPTYLFIVTMFAAIAWGVFETVVSGGHPRPVVAPPAAPKAVAAFSLWLVMKAFASGCTAMTGVEAVSNGVRAFREPTTQTAQRTLGVIIGCLVVMLGGIAYLARAYGILATDPNGNNYQSVLSLLFLAVNGRGWFYYVSIFSVLAVLIFSANTAFADFPRVCRVIAEDRYLPLLFANRGRRLVYSQGVVVLAVLVAILLTAFGGVTDRLIPLFAVGAFLAFTLSQAGMVAHWLREGGGKKSNILLNGAGAVATGITVCVVILAKFKEGAWITVVIIPVILLLMYRVRRHYDRIFQDISRVEPLNLEKSEGRPLIVLPLQNWTAVAQSALCDAYEMSEDIHVVYVSADEEQPSEFEKVWEKNVAAPARAAKRNEPELVCIRSPYRFVIGPIVDYVLEISRKNPDRRVVAMVPELVERRWYNYLLHSHRATLIKANLLMKGSNRISVLNVPWYLS